MSKSRILARNYLDLDVVSNATVSSEQAAFPVTNLYNLQRRSKVWRSNGNWEITSSNKTLVFRETIGVDLTATLTEGAYASTALLLAHIKSKMEAVGDSTYTLSVDSTTQKIKFVSNLAGGGNIFQIIWTSSTGLASTLGFLTTENDTGASTYLADILRISTGEWIKWDFGISTLPKAFVLIGPRNAPIKITPSATIKLQGAETDMWTSPTFSADLEYDDSVIYLLNSSGLHTEALRYWRLLIQDLSNPNGYVEAGALYLGDVFEPSQGAVQFPFSGEFIDRSETVFSEGGQTFSDIAEKSDSFSLEWRGLTTSEKEQLDTIWNDIGISSAFFVQLDPDSAFSSSSASYIRYVKMTNPIKYQLLSPGFWVMNMNLREEL